MLGDVIKGIRENSNLEIKDIAERTGLSAAYISMIENNIRTNPSTKALNKIASALEVSINDFFLDTEDSKPEINIPTEYTDKYKVTSRDKKQYEEEMKKANEAFFLNDELSDDAKKEMLDLMSELFWRAKEKNKRKK